MQRCIYAFAVKSLLESNVEVQAALLFPRASESQQPFRPLPDVDNVLATLARSIELACANLENGLALPGIDAGDEYNDFSFAFPVNAAGSYLVRKRERIEQRLGAAAEIWETI